MAQYTKQKNNGKKKQFPSKVEAVLFDIDGTLTHSDHVHLVAFQQLLQEIQFQPPFHAPGCMQKLSDGTEVISEEFYAEHISGKHNAQIATDLFPGWPVHRGVAFAQRKEALFREMAADILVPQAGLNAFITRLRARGIRIAAVTNAPRVNAEFMLKAIHHTETFAHCLVIGEECEYAKPFPHPYLKAAKALGVDPANCVVVEDSVSGAHAGKQAGCFVIGITTSQTPEYLIARGGVDATISDFADPALAKLFRPAFARLRKETEDAEGALRQKESS